MKKDNLKDALFDINKEKMNLMKEMEIDADVESISIENVFKTEKNSGKGNLRYRRIVAIAAVFLVFIISVSAVYGDRLSELFVKRKDYETLTVYLSKYKKEPEERKIDPEKVYPYLYDNYRVIYSFAGDNTVHIQLLDLDTADKIDFYRLNADTVFKIRNETGTDDFKNIDLGNSNIIVADSNNEHIYIWEDDENVYSIQTPSSYSEEKVLKIVENIR